MVDRDLNIYIYPTDTVWGIGGKISSYEIYKKTLRVKKHPSFRPVSVLFSKIEQIKDYFSISLDHQLLDNFFKLESTLGLDIETIKGKKIPSWIYQDSNFVAIRCLSDIPIIDQIIRKTREPIITTSLNLVSESPVTTYQDACIFKNKYLPQAIIQEKSSKELSGVSSSIIWINRKNKIKVIRSGRLIDEIFRVLKP